MGFDFQITPGTNHQLGQVALRLQEIVAAGNAQVVLNRGIGLVFLGVDKAEIEMGVVETLAADYQAIQITPCFGEHVHFHAQQRQRIHDVEIRGILLNQNGELFTRILETLLVDQFAAVHEAQLLVFGVCFQALGEPALRAFSVTQ